VVVRITQCFQEPVAGFFQRKAVAVEYAEEEVEAFVDGVAACFDQAVGVEDQLIARAKGHGGRFEGDATDPEGCTSW
jgi:hypothetical protein